MKKRLLRITLLTLILCLAYAVRTGAGTAYNADGTTYNYAYLTTDWGGFELDSTPQLDGGLFLCPQAPFAPLFPAILADC